MNVTRIVNGRVISKEELEKMNIINEVLLNIMRCVKARLAPP